jgi:hypothetical protein
MNKRLIPYAAFRPHIKCVYGSVPRAVASLAYSGLRLDVQVKDDFEACAQVRLRLSTWLFANFAPLRLCEKLSHAV